MICLNVVPFMKGDLSPSGIFSSWKYKHDFAKAHPEYFGPDGITVFCGPQGSGKTLSMVNYAYNLAKFYPNCLIVSNVDLIGFPYPERIFKWSGVRDLMSYHNGYSGVLYLIDEMHILFNSLESKNIDFSVFQEISQQRKQRKHIVGTSQVFQRLAKPFREQFKYAVVCNCLLGCIQFNRVLDGAYCSESSDGSIHCDKVSKYFYVHTPQMYERYDTYAKIER